MKSKSMELKKVLQIIANNINKVTPCKNYNYAKKTDKSKSIG